jgi:uncharacterized protein (TIGR02145 family)
MKKINIKVTFLFLLILGVKSYGQAAGNGVTDIDGHTYNSVIIGTQEWTKENLNVSRYTDGTIIPQVTDPIVWSSLSTGAWCYYNNDPANGAIYGKLYNWYAVAGIFNAASLTNPLLRKKLAPIGWHVQSDDEWTTLTTYLGGTLIAGGKMKATGTIQSGTGLWQQPNTDATNESGFAALPGGSRNNNGTFGGIGFNCILLTSLEYDNNSATSCYLRSYNGNADIGIGDKYYGISVRCIKGQALSLQNITSAEQVNVFPNPAHSFLNLSINDDISLDKITILDITGKIVLEQAENLNTINVEKLAKGVYILTAYAGDKKYQEKFIKE